MKKEYAVELTEEEADELMEEHWVGELVRCKDCKYGRKPILPFRTECVWCERVQRHNSNYWFCADGVAKGINVPGEEGR